MAKTRTQGNGVRDTREKDWLLTVACIPFSDQRTEISLQVAGGKVIGRNTSQPLFSWPCRRPGSLWRVEGSGSWSWDLSVGRVWKSRGEERGCLEVSSVQLSHLTVIAVTSHIFGTEIVNVLWHLEAWFYNLQCCAAFLPFIQYILTEHPLSVGPVLDIRVITLSKAVLIHGAHCSDT